jgi:hypothetical protein
MRALFTVIAILVLAPRAALAFDLHVEPAAVAVGDPYMVWVTGAAEPGEPVADTDGSALPLGTCGPGCYVAVGGVALTEGSGTRTITVTHAGQSMRQSIAVTEGTFPVQNITLPDNTVNLSEEDDRRATLEAIKLRAIWAQVDERQWEGDFIMPLGGSFSTAFGARRIINQTNTTRHRGIDIRGRKGAPVLAANHGTVSLAEEHFYGGNTIVVDHGQGIYSVYLHLSAFKVGVGDHVAKGQVIGLVGSTGRSTGPHLHYTVKVAGESINPKAMAALPLSAAAPGAEVSPMAGDTPTEDPAPAESGGTGGERP